VNRDQIADHLSRRLAGWEPLAAPEPLSGGLLNETWRAPGKDRSVIVKHAPPYIATAPDVPLDPGRAAFEARALFALAPEGRLSHVPVDSVRPPLPIDFDEDRAVLVMEDLGSLPDLGADWRQPDSEVGGAGLAQALGSFVGRLHAATLDDGALAREFANLPIQRTRHEVQYCAVGPALRSAGIPEAEEHGARAVELGRRLQQPGRCLVMGDLWPPSVLRDGHRLRVIDWEFTHFGIPAQDLGHLAAHAWMHRHRARDRAAADALAACWQGFLTGYRAAAGAAAGRLLDEGSRRDAALHCGAEILVRTIGPFREGYLYGGRPPDSAEVREAVDAAVQRMQLAAAAPEPEQLL
jgi:hypothetical protein